MVKGVKNRAFGVDNLSNINSVIALGCIHSMNKKKTSSRHPHINQNGLKLSVASCAHSTLNALGELECLYRGTSHFLFIQSLSLPSEFCFFIFCLVYRPDPNWATIQISSYLSHDIYIGSHFCLVSNIYNDNKKSIISMFI